MSLFGKRHVAVEQKSSDSAISCPTSNIACCKFWTYLKRRKLVVAASSIRPSLGRFWDNFSTSLERFWDSKQTNLGRISNLSKINFGWAIASISSFQTLHKMLDSLKQEISRYLFVTCLLSTSNFLLSTHLFFVTN